ncbi:MAG TPA: PRC-barrel domain-containing protein, partial [Actinomycetota bacterium]|nr:PRC-barrel domain-containing protein [Actinomycetota bacterium]
MDSTNVGTLVRMADADLTVADPADDVRGRTVVDATGDEIGDVKSLLIDEDERKVRFLEVESGGFLGLGSETRLVPVDAVTRVEENAVHVDQTRESVHGSPAYDPELEQDAAYYGEVYSYYRYPPYWA